MSRTPKAAPLGGFNVGGQLGLADGAPLASNSGLFDAGPLALPPFSSGLGVPQSLSVPFSPAQISGLDLWLRADLGITLSGSNVQTWADQSGNHKDCNQFSAPSQPGQPTANAGLNNQLAVNFAATQSLAGPTSLATVPRDFWIVTNNTGAAAFRMFTARMSGQWAQYCTAYAASLAPNLAWTDGVNIPNNMTLFSPISVAPHIYHFTTPVTIGGAITLYMDGSASNTPASQPSGDSAETGSAGYLVGYPVAGNVGGVAEIISYNRLLLGNEYPLVNAYLKARYGFP